LEFNLCMAGRALTSACALAALFGAGAPAFADRIKHPTAVFAGLDKITGRIIAFEAAIDETVQFGSLRITPRVCYTRPPTEAPLTTGFVEVEEALSAQASAAQVSASQVSATDDKKFKRIFGGWMFAASPGLHGIEHAVYDAWLTDCKGGTQVIADSVARAEPESAKPEPAVVPRQRRQTPPSAAQQPLQQSPPAARAPSRAPDLGPPVEVGGGPGAPPRPPGNVGRTPPPPPPPASAPQQQRRQPSQSFFPSPF
jgi:hypothetical protein